MANIWDEIEIEWDGETYTVRPTLDFINNLEQGQGRSLARLFTRLTSGDMPSGIACELIAKTLTWAGHRITAEEVYAETSGGINIDAVKASSNILIGCMPKAKGGSEKKSAAKKSRKSQKK